MVSQAHAIWDSLEFRTPAILWSIEHLSDGSFVGNHRTALIAYFHEVRALTKERLERTPEEEFDRTVSDEHFGSIRCWPRIGCTLNDVEVSHKAWRAAATCED